MKLLGLLSGVVVLAGLACKSTPSGNGNGCSSVGADYVIEATDAKTFQPAQVTVSFGKRVCWEVSGTLIHTVTADPNAQDTTWKIDAQIDPEGVAQIVPGKIGVNLLYHCKIHSGMTGELDIR